MFAWTPNSKTSARPREGREDRGPRGDRGPRRDGGGGGADRGPRPERSNDDGPAPEFAPAFLTRDDD